MEENKSISKSPREQLCGTREFFSVPLHSSFFPLSCALHEFVDHSSLLFEKFGHTTRTQKVFGNKKLNLHGRTPGRIDTHNSDLLETKDSRTFSLPEPLWE